MASNNYTVIDSGIITGQSKLIVVHNAGFFSCSTIALQDIMIYFNQNKGLPDVVERASQYMMYKTRAWDNLIPMFFEETGDVIPYERDVSMSDEGREIQYTDYKRLVFPDLKPFMDKFFAPSNQVRAIIAHYEKHYQIDYDNTCAVFYRGNDKNRETTIASYEAFINRASQLNYEGLKFLVQPDETEFLEAFTAAHLNSFNFIETPHIRKQDSAVFLEMPVEKRSAFAARFLAAVIVMSRCKYLITHTGNCGMWATLYRGHADNVYQIRDNEWIS